MLQVVWKEICFTKLGSQKFFNNMLRTINQKMYKKNFKKKILKIK